MSDAVTLSRTTDRDLQAVQKIHESAFGQDEEASLVVDLLQDHTAQPTLSLIARYGPEPIGHILFSRVYLEAAGQVPLMHILAPLAVLPAWQDQGVGGRLIQTGLEHLKALGSALCLVLGHPAYYPRFGFVPDAAAQGLLPPYPIPAEHADAWMAQWLIDDPPKDWKGKIRCADALDKAEYWKE